MFDSIKNFISGYIVSHHLKKVKDGPRSFSNLYKNSKTIVVLMPEEETDFKRGIDILSILEQNGKTVTAFTNDFRIGLFPTKMQSSVIGFSPADLTKTNLPSKSLRAKLSAHKADLVVDLNRTHNLFYGFAANLFNSSFRIGVKTRNSDRFYNLQISGTEDNPELFYKNFLNCLQMF